MSFTYLKYQTLRFLDALGHCEFDFEKAFDQIHKPRKRLQMNDECEKCLDQRKCTLADMKNDYEFKERFPYIYIKNFGYPDPERFTP